MPRTLAVDFDGVIHAYTKGWQNGSIYDNPVPGAFKAIKDLMLKFAIFVHTSRNPELVADWIQRNSGIPCVVDLNPTPLEFWNTQGKLLVTNRKLPAVAYIDDRAIQFVNWTQAIEHLHLMLPEVIW